jgi:hypothetical protein
MNSEEPDFDSAAAKLERGKEIYCLQERWLKNPAEYVYLLLTSGLSAYWIPLVSAL